MRKRFLILTVLLLSVASVATAEDKSKLVSYTGEWQAFAPNAGGQKAYALRRGTNDSEWSLFLNEFLTTGNTPLIGGLYGLRFNVCDQSCFWQFFVTTSAGISTGGPTIDVSWSTVVLWIARLDFSTQIFFTRNRIVTWSYPLWMGVSIPSPF